MYLETLKQYYDKNVDKIKLYIDKDDPEETLYEYTLVLRNGELPLCGPIYWYACRELTVEENKEAFMQSVRENITPDLKWIRR